jgi:uncharacterized protein YcbX
MPVVSALFIYPIKSCASVSVTELVYTSRGISDDRRFMIVDEAGQAVTQRENPRLAHIFPTITSDGLLVSYEGKAPTTFPFCSAERRRVKLWRYQGDALDLGDEAADWVSTFIEQPCRLVEFAPDATRAVSKKHTTLDAETQFSDGYPILLTTLESLSELNRRLRTPVPMNRFRPNLVVRDAAPFAEDRWKLLEFPNLKLHVVKPCERCVITTTNQVTLERQKEPLRTLATFRNFDGRICFGQNCVPEAPGVIRLGDVAQSVP